MTAEGLNVIIISRGRRFVTIQREEWLSLISMRSFLDGLEFPAKSTDPVTTTWRTLHICTYHGTDRCSRLLSMAKADTNSGRL